MNLSRKTKHLVLPSTFQMAMKAMERKKQGLPVYNLGIGEPDLGMPEHVKEAAKQAIDENFSHYTAVGGMPTLKEALAQKFERDQGICYTHQEITTANGAKQILFNLFQVLLEEGDEVLVPDPAWLTYETQIAWAGGRAVFVPTYAEENFQLKAAQIEAKMTPRTKALILNSPTNPTGAVITGEELKKIAQLAEKHHLLIISDDVYEFFYYDAVPGHILKIAPHLREQVVLVNAISKTYAMTGWRLGYAAGPKEIIQAMELLQGQSASNPCSISQRAALVALTGPQNAVTEMRTIFARRRQLLNENLTSYKAHFVPAQGAFYTMIDVRPLLKSGGNDTEFCERMLQEKGLVFVPGSAFGKQSEGWVRLSFAVPDQVLDEALDLLFET